MRSVRLGDVLTRVRRPILVDPESKYREIGIRSHGKGIFHKEPRRGIELGSKKIFAIEPGDLVLNIVFAWEGAVAVASYNEQGMCASHRFPTYRPVSEGCDIRYIARYLLSEPGLQILRLASPGSAGRNRTLNQTAMLEQSILLPSRAEQWRIMDLLGSAESAEQCASLTGDRAIAARDALLNERLNPYSGWPLVRIGEIVTVNPKEPPLPEDAPFVPMDAVEVGARWIARTERRGTRAGARFRAGDVLFARITPCLENGKVAQVPPSLARGGGSTEFIVLRASDAIHDEFLYPLLTAPRLRSEACSLMTGSTGRQRLSGADLANLRIPLPPLDQQAEIAETAEVLAEVARRSRDLAATLATSRGRLIADLLSGFHRIRDTYDALREQAS